MLRAIPQALIVRLGWTSGTFAVLQLLRLINNVVLARLLAPPLFGLMVMVNAIRTGLELVSDVGISQNIVSSKRGATPDFYDTAWTLKVIRGIGLGAILYILSDAFASFFEEPQLQIILPVIALTLVLSGFQSTNRALLQKELKVARLGSFEVVTLGIIVATQIGLALITPTIWALVLGMVIASCVGLASSYLIIPGRRHRFVIHPECAREIIVFGKWIFASSIIYFLAMNFDRLYFAKQISLAELGVYGIARTLADMLSNLALRSSNLLVFPTVAAMQATAPEVRRKVLHGRRTMLLLVALGLAGFVAVSDVVVGLLYDSRYAQAALILPLLLLGAWLAILSTVNDSILLGTARPAYPAFGHGAKLLTYVVGVPLAFTFYGFLAAVLVLSAGEAVRYIAVWTFSRRQHLGFGRDDLALTILFLLAIFALRKLLWAIGLTGDLDALFPMLQPEFWAR